MSTSNNPSQPGGTQQLTFTQQEVNDMIAKAVAQALAGVAGIGTQPQPTAQPPRVGGLLGGKPWTGGMPSLDNKGPADATQNWESSICLREDGGMLPAKVASSKVLTCKPSSMAAFESTHSEEALTDFATNVKVHAQETGSGYRPISQRPYQVKNGASSGSLPTVVSGRGKNGNGIRQKGMGCV